MGCCKRRAVYDIITTCTNAKNNGWKGTNLYAGIFFYFCRYTRGRPNKAARLWFFFFFIFSETIRTLLLWLLLYIRTILIWYARLYKTIIIRGIGNCSPARIGEKFKTILKKFVDTKSYVILSRISGHCVRWCKPSRLYRHDIVAQYSCVQEPNLT